MKFFFRLVVIIFLVSIFNSCKSDDNDDCKKIIDISQFYYINNQSYSYEKQIEVPCDFPEPEPVQITPPELENFTYEVLSFIYTSDTGNETSRLQFEIKLNNPNNYEVKGIPYLTIVSDDLEISNTYPDASIPCNGIKANSTCTLKFDKEYPIDRDLGTVKSMKLKSVTYYLTNKI